MLAVGADWFEVVVFGLDKFGFFGMDILAALAAKTNLHTVNHCQPFPEAIGNPLWVRQWPFSEPVNPFRIRSTMINSIYLEVVGLYSKIEEKYEMRLKMENTYTLQPQF